MDKIFQELTGFFRCYKDNFLTLDTSVSQNCSLSSILGYSLDEIEKDFENCFINLIVPDDREIILEKLEERFSKSNIIEFTCRLFHKDGHIIWGLFKSKLETVEDGTQYFSSILIDITQTHAIHNYSEKTLRQYEIILSQTENIIFEYDLASDTIFLSDTWEKILGYKPSTKNFLKTLNAVSHLHPTGINTIVHEIEHFKNSELEYKSVESQIQRIDGQYIWVRIRATALRDKRGNVTKFVGIIINIDAEKRAEKELQQRAEQDALTKLLNKGAGKKKMEDYLSINRGNMDCSLLIIDLDDFKKINDCYGHMFGDQVLVRVANEIKNVFRSDDIVTRVGGDEFMVLMKNVADPILVQKRCRQLIYLLRNQNIISNEKTCINCSIGIAFAPEHGSTFDTLYLNADDALYRAKAMGKGCYAIFNQDDF